MEPDIGIKVLDRAGKRVTVLVRQVGSDYYAVISDGSGKAAGSSSVDGTLGRGATIDAAIRDLLDARERARLRESPKSP